MCIHVLRCYDFENKIHNEFDANSKTTAYSNVSYRIFTLLSLVNRSSQFSECMTQITYIFLNFIISGDRKKK